jgi:hypothetical protein
MPLLFSLISSLNFVVDFGKMLVVHGGDEGDQREGANFVEFLGVLEHFSVFHGHMDLMDVGNKLQVFKT